MNQSAILLLLFCSFPLNPTIEGFSLLHRISTHPKQQHSGRCYFLHDLKSTSQNDNENEMAHLYTLKKRNPYDVHVYYNGEVEREKAMILRTKLKEKFGHWMRFYSPKDKPIGPHPTSMFEADFGSYENRIYWGKVKDFIEKENDGNLSVLIHPHSTDGDYADHTKHAFWIGEVLALRIQGWKR